MEIAGKYGKKSLKRLRMGHFHHISFTFIHLTDVFIQAITNERHHKQFVTGFQIKQLCLITFLWWRWHFKRFGNEMVDCFALLWLVCTKYIHTFCIIWQLHHDWKWHKEKCCVQWYLPWFFVVVFTHLDSCNNPPPPKKKQTNKTKYFKMVCLFHSVLSYF